MNALNKYAAKGRWQADPAWYGAETSHYLKGGRGIYHGIEIRKDGKRSLFSRLTSSSAKSIPKSQVLAAKRRLSKIKGVDVFPDDPGGGRLGSVEFGHAGYLTDSMRNKIDKAIYGLTKKGSAVNALNKYATKKKLIEKLAGVRRLARIRAAVKKRGWGRRSEGLVEAGKRSSDKITRRHERVKEQILKNEKYLRKNPDEQKSMARLFPNLVSPRLPEGMELVMRKGSPIKIRTGPRTGKYPYYERPLQRKAGRK